MKKFISLFEEAQNERKHPPKNLAAFVDEIKENCSRYLNEKLDGYHLYRGLSVSDQFLKTPANTMRKKTWSGDIIPKIIHREMKEAGYEATRLDGRFVISRKDEATVSGGRVYVIFPTDDYDITWSTEFHDIGGGGIMSHLSQAQVDAPLDGPVYTMEQIAELFWKDYEPTLVRGNLPDAMKSGNEIMVKASYLYCISYRLHKQYKLYELL